MYSNNNNNNNTMGKTVATKSMESTGGNGETVTRNRPTASSWCSYKLLLRGALGLSAFLSITFVGRNDDVITSSGYRIGPFDVESALIEHPAVTEAAVVGVPDKERTEIVKAVVVLTEGAERGEELTAELKEYVKHKGNLVKMLEYVMLVLPLCNMGKWI